MKRIVPLIFVLLMIIGNVYAQQYPVTIVPRVAAPAPVNFFNYADDSGLNSPITVQIFLNDITVSNRQIRLKTYFEGNNIRFRSKDFVVGADDLFIEGGIPLTLRNAELAPYYRFENIEGINNITYSQTIPEGSYSFCFEVYDYLSGTKLSTKKCATVFIFKNEPPILNLPFNKTNIEPKDFENIIFQWTPRHINVSNVEYEFSMVEIWDDYINPQTAFLSQTPIFETTTRTTSLVYGPDKPLLLPGKRYAWRVRAKALQGIEEVGLFKNQGYSEIFWFSRTAPCMIPEDISAEPKGISKINIFWNQEPIIYSEFIIAYREADNPDAHWFTKKTNSGWATIWDLKAGTTYEYKVKGKCKYQYSEYSETQRVTTEIIQNEDANYNCGIVPDAIAISNREPHPGLNIGDQITAGDFKVTITELQNQANGIISGKGYVGIPYLNMAKFGVTFNGILVNSSNQLAEGEIVTLYDPEFGEGASMTVDVNINIAETIDGDDGVVEETVTVDFVIESIEVDANGAFVVTGTNGETAIIPGDDDIKIKSDNGEVWSVGEDGTITKQEEADGGAITDSNTSGLDTEGNVDGVTASGVKIIFEASGYYHFDQLPSGTSSDFEKEYKFLEQEGGKYKVPYKAISDTNGEDFIYAKVTINDPDIKRSDVVFKTKEGGKVTVEEWDGDRAKLKLIRKFHYADEEIYAVVKSKQDSTKYDVAGSLITTHLASQELEAINVTLVPIGVGKIDSSIKKEVEEIYKKAGVRLNIQEVNEISPEEVYKWDIDGNGKLKVGDSAMLAHYTDEEQVFNSYIKQQSFYSKNTYYVFVTNVRVSNNEVNGFMPLKRQFGFVFTRNANTPKKQVKTLAHELGHGIFGLKHPWDEYNFAESATNLLMDNGDGIVLSHLDWKKMHAPGIQIYWFQGDEDGQNTIVSSIPKQFANNDKTYTFLTMNGSYITLPKNVKNLSFVTGIDKLNPYIHYPTGALQSFVIEGKKYSAKIDGIIEPTDDYTIENFDFTYNGFKNYSVEERDKYHGSVITVVPDGSSRRLLRVRVKDLTFQENEKVNILKKNTYDKFQKVLISENKIVEKRYKYGETTPYDGSYVLNQELVQQFLGEGINWKEHYFIASKLAFLNNTYPDIIEEIFPRLALKSDTQSHLPSDKAYVGLKGLSIEKLIDVYIKLVNGVRGKVSNCYEMLSNININASFRNVKACIDNLSDKEIEKLPVDSKITALSILTNWSVVTTNSTEIEIIRLLKFTQKKDVDKLLDKLKGKTAYENSDDFILKRLVYKVDNDHTYFTDDNYLELVKTLSLLASKSEKFKKSVLEYSDEEFLKRIIDFYHRSFWDGVKESLGTNPTVPYVKCTPDTNVNWVSKDDVKIKIQNTVSCNLIEYPTSDTPLEVDPITPIWFVNKSSLSMLSDYNKNNPVLAPAILAYYANDVGNTKNIIDGVEATVDVISLFSGAGALAKAPTHLRKAFIIADMIGSGVNITLASSSENLNPEVKKVLQALNVLTAIIAVGELADGVKSLKTFFTKAKSNTKDLPSKSEVESFINSILNDKVSPEELAKIGTNKLKEAEKWLDNIILEGKASGSMDLAVKAKTAKAKILSIKELLKINPNDLKSVLNLTGSEISLVKNYLNKSDDYIDVIVHSNKVGDKFSIIIEVNGKVDEVVLSAKDFARTLSDVPTNKTIRLLSCNNTDSAKEIASVLNRDIITSSGEMKLYDNGLIETGSWFIAKPGGKIEDYRPKKYNLDATDNYIILGEKLDDPLLEAIRIGKRSDGTLADALRAAGYPKSADAVKGAGNVSKNNKKWLDSGDSQIPNAKTDYRFTRNGVTYEIGTPPAGPNEKWKAYFTRLNKIIKENGKDVKHFNQFESHHIFPVDLFKRESFRKWFENFGHKHYDINGDNSLENLIMLEAIRRNPITDKGNPNFLGGVHTNHPQYTERIGAYIDNLWKDAKSANKDWDDLKIAREIDDDIVSFSENLKQSLLENSVRGDVELPTYWDNIDFEQLKNK
ncbi:Fibronectin type III domain protein [Tenacibaculum sp. 190524A02b]|uniref:fibronectin type III domain-containing protein n=1 Tax=Tenacibaculum vairaonense TaxID=3137860 RepID=UPI0032B2535D